MRRCLTVIALFASIAGRNHGADAQGRESCCSFNGEDCGERAFCNKGQKRCEGECEGDWGIFNKLCCSTDGIGCVKSRKCNRSSKKCAKKCDGSWMLVNGKDEAEEELKDELNEMEDEEQQLSIVGATVKFGVTSTVSQIAALGAARVAIGDRTFFIGTRQAGPNNQDPILAIVNRDTDEIEVRTDFETTGADGRGRGLFYDGTNLYAMFTTDGTQGAPEEDWRRVSKDATQSWLRSYGRGGGAKASVIAQIDPVDGSLIKAAYLSAVLTNGNSNTLIVDHVSKDPTSGNLIITASSWFNPRNPDGSKMAQMLPGASPFEYTIEMTPDLKTVVKTSSPGWTDGSEGSE